MGNLNSLALICGTYMLTIFLGLNTAAFLFPLMYPIQGQPQLIQPLVDNPQSVSSSAQIFIPILFVTVIMLVLMRSRASKLIHVAIAFSFFFGMTLTLAPLIGDLAIVVSLVATIGYYLSRGSILYSNIMLVFSISGIGAWLGASLGFLPAVALIILMSVYDIIAVFVTKHMVALAKAASGRFPLMLSFPVGEKTLGLGAGDIAIPLAFSVSIFHSFGIGYAIPTAIGGLMGLVWLFFYMDGRKGVTLPALPPIVAGLFLGFGLCAAVLGLPL